MPLVLRGCLDEWAAYGCWSIEFFKKRYGDAKVDVDMGSHGGARRAMTLREYVNAFPDYEQAHRLHGAPVPYLRCGAPHLRPPRPVLPCPAARARMAALSNLPCQL